MTEYDTARTAQLRVFLLIAAGIGALLGMLGLLQVVADPNAFTVLVLLAGSVATGCAVLGVRRLPEESRPAKTVYAAAGALQIVLGLLLAGSALGLIPIVVGILLLLLALTREAEPT